MTARDVRDAPGARAGPRRATGSGAPRRRDPQRADRILDAAAELIGRDGYPAVGMAAIGAAAGIVSSGIYRHFDGKAAVLAALFDRVLGPLTADADRIVRDRDPQRALDGLVDAHVCFALDQRRLLQVYHQEFRHVPEPDRGRLRTRQRRYLDQWVDVLTAWRHDLGEAEAHVLVRAAIGAIHSVLFSSSDLDRTSLHRLLRAVAWSALTSPGRAGAPT